MRLYKLTDYMDRTHGGCQWGVGVTVETDGVGELCGPGYTHWYTSPLVAVFLNPIHGNFDLVTAHLWEGEGAVVKDDRGLKVGCTKATTLQRVELPVLSTAVRVRVALECAKLVCTDTAWNAWADKWLSGKDRKSVV